MDIINQTLETWKLGNIEWRTIDLIQMEIRFKFYDFLS